MMDDKEMKRRKVAINLVQANVFGIVLMVISAIVLLVPFFMIWGDTFPTEINYTPLESGLYLVAFVIGIVVHELIHGLTWAQYAKGGWKSISFGVIWKMLTPYCHCDVPLNKRAYMMGALMPLLVLGVLPGMAGVAFGSLPLVIWGIIFISAAAGDIWMAWLLSKEDAECLFLDHPSEAGFYVLDKNDTDFRG